ncbi:MAG: polysaccharide biosynthesis tyrosine autokinase [Candidatus Promineifilaceae bacterium]
MELKQYYSIIVRRKWIIIITTVAITLLAVIFTYLTTPQYQSSTTLRVATVENISYTQILMNTYAQIVKSSTVKTKLKEELQITGSPIIRVELIPDTELMVITAEAQDPEEAQAIAAKAASLLAEQSRDIYSGSGQTTAEILSQQVGEAESELDRARSEYEDLLANSPEDKVALDASEQSISLKERTLATLLDQYERARTNEALIANSVSIVEPANLPVTPSKPNKTLNIVLGALVGLLGGIVLAFLVDNLDTRMYSVDQIESVTMLPTMGTIPASKNEKLTIARLNDGSYPQVEAFRRLRTNLVSLERNQDDNVVMITSAQRGEGKSTISANLAVALSQSGRTVVVVDCDMRLPALHKIFDLPNKRGLTSILTKDISLEEAVLHSVYPRLTVLTSGPLPPNPTELLGSFQMVELVEKLRQEYDYVLLDTPALLSVADAAVVTPIANTVVWVISQGQTRRSDVEAVRRQLLNVGVKSIDVVINRSSLDNDYAAYGQEQEFYRN